MSDVCVSRRNATYLSITYIPLLMIVIPTILVDAELPENVTFDDVKFEIEKNEDFSRQILTDKINNFEGKRIKIRGYIRPSFKQTGIEKFILVRDNQECCFGPGAMIYDCMIVGMKKGTATEFTTRPITVEGDFYLKEFEGPDGKLWAIYRLRNATVL
ncbi:MAG: hypothetical protein VXY07_04570 [Planctomycetota bacterium]|jgi:hypothetical protein|nr:hypothetical protein [Planctomycetota bacterium]MEC8389067.1 hypothetical protein [Planctomycetota bacterium]MEC8590404.1 hypothetical protein [Planctomycetota bacterium]MEC8782077.1 hypothetical protein [Planctomycetota bacterium]